MPVVTLPTRLLAMRSRKRTRGFSLVELLVTLSIFAIVLAMAVPSFQSFLLKNQARGIASDLSRSLWQARNQALALGRAVTVCARAEDGGCLASQDWTRGWLVYRGPATTAPAADTLIAEVSREAGALTLTVTAQTLSFSGAGTVSQADRGTVNFVVHCTQVPETLFNAISVARNGRISSQQDRGQGCD
ncbi:prepilin-type N-terminal cleavage/methylation domain-containing protein [Rhodobacteraceae bacterium CH30]|nr:prepilin-type N-terminal cleavage/methylation domain-containing protein [Rhodobacteraceae bacterium CH30]